MKILFIIPLLIIPFLGISQSHKFLTLKSENYVLDRGGEMTEYQEYTKIKIYNDKIKIIHMNKLINETIPLKDMKIISSNDEIFIVSQINKPNKHKRYVMLNEDFLQIEYLKKIIIFKIKKREM